MRPPLVPEIFVRFFRVCTAHESAQPHADVFAFWKSRTYDNQIDTNRLQQPQMLDYMRAQAISLLVDTAGVAARKCRNADENLFDLMR